MKTCPCGINPNQCRYHKVTSKSLKNGWFCVKCDGSNTKPKYSDSIECADCGYLESMEELLERSANGTNDEMQRTRETE